MLSPVDDDEDEDVRAAVTCTFLVLKAVKEEEGANASVVQVVVAATTASVRAVRARRSKIMARARSLEIYYVVRVVLPQSIRSGEGAEGGGEGGIRRMTHIVTYMYVRTVWQSGRRFASGSRAPHRRDRPSTFRPPR